MSSLGYDDICVPDNAQFLNHAMAHEVGHNVMRRHLNYEDGISLCNQNQAWETSSGDRCSTSEGWAMFFATAIYWLPSSDTPWYRSLSWNMEGSIGGGTCVNAGSSPELSIGNVARFFWDVYDTTSDNEYFVDVFSISFAQMIEAWDEFPSSSLEGCISSDCIDNLENNEGYTTDLDNWNGVDVVDWNGRNVWDYEEHFNNYTSNVGALYGIINNCLDSQEAN